VTGCPAACLTTLGPGVASVVNGVACAQLERAPLVVFTDTYASHADFAHQQLDHRALLAPITKWSATISADNADEVIAEALAHAMAHPRGPVHIDCPAGVLSHEVLSRQSPVISPQPRRLTTDDSRLMTVLDSRLTTVSKPLLIVGLNARDAA